MLIYNLLGLRYPEVSTRLSCVVLSSLAPILKVAGVNPETVFVNLSKYANLIFSAPLLGDTEVVVERYVPQFPEPNMLHQTGVASVFGQTKAFQSFSMLMLI